METLVSFKPVHLAVRSGGENGRLVFAGDWLVAVIAQVDDPHSSRPHQWIIRAGFGPCATDRGRAFNTLQEVSVWINNQGPGLDQASIKKEPFPASEPG
ncbi:hypothetical protein [Microvirga alba]|uniref:Uncharacterized protein n=1 Tax=Microvirga alba TaxID=2791025 RepID=A0A931BTM3_9HYPH|nr:hypothetical protein [Microvirga alba]MBF9234539.1 hypothetical protein [Microvirga alba]